MGRLGAEMRGPDQSRIWRVPSVPGVEAFTARVTRFSYARHSHDSYALGTVDQGAMRFWHSGSVHTASPGTVIALNPAEVHDGRAGSPEGCRYRMLYIERGAIDHLFAAEALPTGRTLALRGPVLHDVQLAQAVRRLHETLDRVDADAGLQLEQQARFVEVLFGVLARYGAPAPAGLRMGAEACCVARAREYLDEHLGEPVTLLDLAAAVGLSPFSFSEPSSAPPACRRTRTRINCGWRGPAGC